MIERDRQSVRIGSWRFDIGFAKTVCIENFERFFREEGNEKEFLEGFFFYFRLRIYNYDLLLLDFLRPRAKLNSPPANIIFNSIAHWKFHSFPSDPTSYYVHIKMLEMTWIWHLKRCWDRSDSLKKMFTYTITILHFFFIFSISFVCDFIHVQCSFPSFISTSVREIYYECNVLKETWIEEIF